MSRPSFPIHCDPCHGNCSACKSAQQFTPKPEPTEPPFFDFSALELLCGALIIVMTIGACVLSAQP